MLRFLTAGESHGQALVVIVEGLPAGLSIDPAVMAADLKRRQGGYGHGRRMAIESDTAEVLSGIRKGETLGGPVALVVRNRDWTNWQNTMHVGAEPPPDATGARRAKVTRPRPGHADLAGVLKYEREDMRDILERASARASSRVVATPTQEWPISVISVSMSSAINGSSSMIMTRAAICCAISLPASSISRLASCAPTPRMMATS